jgi:hypothetical protein
MLDQRRLYPDYNIGCQARSMQASRRDFLLDQRLQRPFCSIVHPTGNSQTSRWESLFGQKLHNSQTSSRETPRDAAPSGTFPHPVSRSLWTRHRSEGAQTAILWGCIAASPKGSLAWVPGRTAHSRDRTWEESSRVVSTAGCIAKGACRAACLQQCNASVSI